MARPITADGGLRAGATAGWRSASRDVTRSAAWPVPVETDDPLPQPGEVRTGWNRREPLAASGGPARIPPFRSVARWLAPPSDRPIVTAPLRVTARPESARPPVGNGTAHHSGRRPARWGHCRVEVCVAGVTRSAAGHAG